MALTGLAVSVDRDEYSRFEADKDTVTVTIVPTGTSFIGNQVTVDLVKARRNKDVSIGQLTITLTGAAFETTTFYLPNMLDAQDQFPKARRGSYLARAQSVLNPLVVGDSPNFLISIMTVDRFKHDYLFGAHLRAFEILAVHNQPTVITGVTITNVSLSHQQGWFTLSYTYNDPGGGNPIIRTLSWCGGPAVTIVPGKTNYTLRKGSTNDYVDVFVSQAALPTASASEQIFIERATLDDKRIREHLDAAISWIEDSELAIYMEPTIVATEFDPTAVAYPPGSDIPTFVKYDVDKRVDAITFWQAQAGHWLNIRFPYYPLLRLDTMYGKIANVRILNVALEWIEIHEKYGFIELVPFNQEVAFNFIGLMWVEALRGPVPLPNFWNFQAVVGFRDTPKVLIELMAKKAAVDVLTIAGLAYRGGLSGTSLSRDGISESVSYNLAAQFGIYNGAIYSYKLWIDENVVKLRGAFRGPNLQVV